MRFDVTEGIILLVLESFCYTVGSQKGFEIRRAQPMIHGRPWLFREPVLMIFASCLYLFTSDTFPPGSPCLRFKFITWKSSKNS